MNDYGGVPGPEVRSGLRRLSGGKVLAGGTAKSCELRENVFRHEWKSPLRSTIRIIEGCWNLPGLELVVAYCVDCGNPASVEKRSVRLRQSSAVNLVHRAQWKPSALGVMVFSALGHQRRDRMKDLGVGGG